MAIGVSIIRNRSGSRAAQTVPYRFPNSEFGAWTSVMDESRFFFPFHSTLVDHVLTDKRLHQGEKTGEEGRERERIPDLLAVSSILIVLGTQSPQLSACVESFILECWGMFAGLIFPRVPFIAG